MQTKIIDYSSQIKTKEVNKRIKLVLVGLFLLLFSIFGARYIFADVSVEFEKRDYSVMEGTSTLVGFTVFNNKNTTVNLLVWADCDDQEDVECNYSQRITLSPNSSQTSSFYVTGVDDSSTTLSVFVNELNTNQIKEFRINIDVLNDEDEGYFEVDPYNTSLCIGKTNNLIFEINNDYRSGLYNLSLTSDILRINQEIQNPVYLSDEREISYLVYVPENIQDGQNFNLRYTIENEEISEIKTINVYTRNCPDTYVDFSVTGPSTISYYVNKNEEKIITYTIKNNSLNNKTIYISEEHAEEKIDVNITKRQITLSPNSFQTVDIKIKTTQDIKSGNYEINFNFFDGINNITKKIRLVVNPEHSIEVDSLNNLDQTLVIGKNLELLFLIKNKGDIFEEFTITTLVDNDIKIRSSENSFSVYPGGIVPYSVYLSAGNNTQTGYSNLNVKVRGKNSDFYKEYNFSINVIRDTPTAALEFLSFPNQINVVPNTTQEVNFILKNNGNTRIIIDFIEIVGVSQEITITSRSDIPIESNENKTIDVVFNIGDLKQDQNAKIRFVTRNGAIFEKNINIRLETSEELEKDKKSGITGFLTLRNSIFTGVIIVCLTIILLFVLGVFKGNRV